jgi:hypothetical protein
MAPTATAIAWSEEPRGVSATTGPRRFAVHGPNAARIERELWTSGLELDTFPRCLIYAGKLGYEFDVYRTGMSSIRARQERIDRGLQDLFALHQRIEGDTRVHADELVDAQSRLSRAEGESAGLFITATRLRELQRTTTIGERNLRALMPDSGDLFASDLEEARWLIEQIDHDLAYMEAVRDRAREAHAITALRIDQAAGEHARLQNRLTLLQTTLLGSLLTGLAAIQTLQARLSLDERLQLPVVAFMMAVALAVPPAVVNWYERYRWFDFAALALLGAAFGWIVLRVSWRAAPSVPSLLAALAGGFIMVLGARLADQKAAGRRR